MISAKEARELMEESEAWLNEHLRKIEHRIKQKCAQGKNILFLYEEFPHNTDFALTSLVNPKLTPLQQRMKQALGELGYVVDIALVPVYPDIGPAREVPSLAIVW